MRIILSAIALLAAGVFVVGYWPHASVLARGCLDSMSGREPAPVAVFETTAIDLGRIESIDPICARFRVTNVGTKRLILARKSTDCPCEQGLHSTVIVPPATTKDLLVPLDGIEGGPATRQIAYSTSDPGLREVTLTVRVEVVGPQRTLKPVPASGIR